MPWRMNANNCPQTLVQRQSHPLETLGWEYFLEAITTSRRDGGGRKEDWAEERKIEKLKWQEGYCAITRTKLTTPTLYKEKVTVGFLRPMAEGGSMSHFEFWK